MRYTLQLKQGNKNTDNVWEDTNLKFNSKKELDIFIGVEGLDFEYRVGYCFKHWDKPIGRFIHNSGKNIGQEVKV